jgi:hypothetical protein
MDGAMSDRPVFEFITQDGNAYRIWPDGRVEGFPAEGVVINRIPSFANQRAAEALAAQAKAA